MKTRDILERLKNPGVIIALVSLVVMILTTNGVNIDNARVMDTVKALCSIGVILGFLNNPTTPGLDLPYVNKDKENK
ncbi:TPA: phage holin [Clostridium perfringens]|nr:hypothetical protein [Clostridium perfringens]HDI3013989.1 hypothetical protein [Clostridium perfringens]